MDDTPDFDDLPSKSQRKRDMDALQDIGAELTELNAQQLDSIELPESLREAVLEARAMKHNEARRRQVQYIGKLMRQVDPAPIRAKLDWLACTHEICVPEKAELAIDLVVGDGKLVPVVRARFAQWRARLPVALNETAGFEWKAGRITLTIPFPRDKPLADPYFYPASDHVIDYAAPQRITRRGNRLIVEAKAAVDGPPVASIEGVLATGRDRGFSLAASPR